MVDRAALDRSRKLFGPDAKLVNERGIRLGQLHARSVFPKSFQIIKFPKRLIEDMNDDIGKIHQYPLAPAEPFDRQGTNPFFTEIFCDPLGDALNLPIGATGTDDKIIRDGSHLVDPHQDKIVGLLLQSEANQEKGLLPGIDSHQSRYIPPRRP